MRVVLPVAFVAVVLVGGCAATPDLEYAASTDGAEAGVEGDSSSGASSSGTSGGSSSGAVDSGQDARPVGDAAAVDTGGPDTNLACPLVVKTGVQCCAGPMPRTCVDQSCQHCNDCQGAACRATEYCCPTVNGGGQYKGTVCKPTSGC
jgi:hypothetical protein